MYRRRLIRSGHLVHVRGTLGMFFGSQTLLILIMLPTEPGLPIHVPQCASSVFLFKILHLLTSIFEALVKSSRGNSRLDARGIFCWSTDGYPTRR